ncbi:MAG: hypothetical protein AAF497_03490 [Planctomycetota bacterium]
MKHSWIVVTLIAMTSSVVAQETEVAEVPVADGTVLFLATPTDAVAVDSLVVGENEWTTGDFVYNPMMDETTYLDWPDVRKELQLAEDQIKKFDKARQKYHKELNVRMRDMQESGPFDHAKYQQEMKSVAEKIKKEAQSILLPHQLERLREVAMQMRMQHQGAGQTLLSPDVVKSLKISDEQRKNIRETAKQAQIEVQKEIIRLQQQVRKQLLGQLTAEQQTKWIKLTGETMKSHQYIDQQEAKKKRETSSAAK